MTVPIQPIRPQYNRAAAKAAGATDEEIDAVIAEYEAQQQNRPVPRRDSTPSDAVRQISAPKPEMHPGEDPTARSQFRPDNLTRQFMQGATFGTFDELSGAADAGLRKLASPITGDTRPLGEMYRTARDKSRGLSNAYKDENPITALGAQAAGSVASGRFLPDVPLGRFVSEAPAATALGRAGQATAKGAANGLWQGAAGGALATDGTFDERMQGAAKGAIAGGVVGGASGGILSAASDLLRKGGQKVASYKATRALDQGRVQEVPFLDDAATAEAFDRTLAKSGMTREQLRAALDQAPEGTTIAEIMGNAGVKRTGTAYRKGLNEPQRIAQSLDERAQDEATNFANKLEGLTGEKIRSPGAVTDEAFAVAEPVAQRGYSQAYQMPDVDSKEVRDMVERFSETRHGKSILDHARELGASFGSLRPDQSPTNSVSIENLNYLRRGIDAEIRSLRSQGQEDLAGVLAGRRATLDKILKEAGGEGQQAADAAIHGANNRAEGFALGERLRSGADPESATEEGIQRALNAAKDKDAVRQGAASNLQNTIRSANDGTGGTIGNPGKAGFGSAKIKARSQLAFDPKDQGPANRFGEANQAAKQVTNRLRTRNTVLGGSQTAERLADDNGDAIGEAVSLIAQGRPVAAARGAVGKQWDKAGRLFNGQQLDAEARILMAGAPGQMSKAEALDLLEAARAVLLRQRSAATSTAANRGGAVGRAAATTFGRAGN